MAFLSPTVSLPPPFPLEEVQVPIVENRLCDLKYHKGLNTGDNVHIVRDDMLCAGNEGHDSCQVSACPPPYHPHPAFIRVLTPILSRATPEDLWSARLKIPGCRQVL